MGKAIESMKCTEAEAKKKRELLITQKNVPGISKLDEKKTQAASPLFLAYLVKSGTDSFY